MSNSRQAVVDNAVALIEHTEGKILGSSDRIEEIVGSHLSGVCGTHKLYTGGRRLSSTGGKVVRLYYWPGPAVHLYYSTL